MIHDDTLCGGVRTEDWFDREVCECGNMHYRCTDCGGTTDGLHGMFWPE